MLELITLDKTIDLDIRYARNDNFVGRPVYDEPRAFLQPVAALALVRAHKNLKKQGFGLVVFDAYRPWSVTKLFWEVVTKEQRPYVADPAVGSRHNRGCAVDLSLYDLSNRTQVEMPSQFDDFVEKSHPDYKGGTELQRANRDLLKEAMESEGFIVNPMEWWHFDHEDWIKYDILDISFEKILSGPQNRT